ncbi:hypothetical protein QL285_008059 [Trifolium repens]|nr:hypothetical protein QL285_008059 [Trifolium repens]
MGRGRGRPRKLVLPSPRRHTQSTPAQRTPVLHAILELSEPADETTFVDEPATADVAGPNATTPVQSTTVSDLPRAESPRLWVDVLSGNRNPANGLAMEFVAPNRVDGEVVVAIDEADIESEVKFWATSLIMYVLGGELSMGAVKQFMIRNWNFVQLPDMFYNDEGYFILRFHSFQDKDAVLMQGPYTIRNMPMLLRDWKPDFSLRRDMLCTVPIWVKLP